MNNFNDVETPTKIKPELYWSKDINEKFREYVSLTADIISQNQIFDKHLYVPLSKMVESLIWAIIPSNYTYIESKDDLKMDCMNLIIHIPSTNYNFDKSVFNYLTTSIINYLCKCRKKMSVKMNTHISLDNLENGDDGDISSNISWCNSNVLNTHRYKDSYLFDERSIYYFKLAIQHKLNDEFISSFLKRFFTGLLYIYSNYLDLDLNKKKIKQLLGQQTGLTQDRLNLYLKKYYPILTEYAIKLKEKNDAQKHIN